MDKLISHVHKRPKIRRNKKNGEHGRRKTPRVVLDFKNKCPRRSPFVQWNNTHFNLLKKLHCRIFFLKKKPGVLNLHVRAGRYT